MLCLFKMPKHKLYFTIIFLMFLSPNFTIDFYSKFHQNDFKLDFQRAELTDYNKSYFNFVEIKTFKYNRSLPVANVTFNLKMNMSTEIELAVQFYKFLSNEYRILPGSNFKVNYCKSIDANCFGLYNMISKCGNMSCEMIQGKTYILCNAFLDESRFPPFLPNGEYKYRVDIIHRNEIFCTIAVYLKIYRPVKPAK